MSRSKVFLFLAAALVVVPLLVLLRRPSDPAETPTTPPPTAAPPLSPRPPAAPPTNPLLTASNRLREKPAATDAAQTLKELQTTLAALPKDQAIAFVTAFLASGQDQPTGLAFEINPDGSLKGWPTLRTFLLDALLALDPAAAAKLSRDLLTATPTSADEWALALRNVGRTDTSPETAAFLRERTEALITNPAWQANPSIGYLNAFDVLVHARATASTPLLSSLIQNKDRKDLAHASFLTLDRLVQRNPVAELTLLLADRVLQASRPEMTAQQFARADLRDPAQQALVKSWLLDPARTPVELHTFAGTYPNNNHFISHNLLTTEAAPTGTDLATHDRAALTLLTTWQADPAFAPVAEPLKTMVSRLTEFTKPATP